jgi:hypothetical protein
MGTWLNNDGLFIKYSDDAGKAKTIGEYQWMEGNTHVIEAIFNWNDINGTTRTILSDTLVIPKTCFLLSAQLITEVPFTSGGVSPVDIGLVDSDRTTEYDFDGIDAAVPKTSMDAANETVTCDGALIGTRLTNNTPCLITMLVSTNAWTAGKGRLIIKYYF